MLRIGPDGEPKIAAYWKLRSIVEASLKARVDVSDEEAVESLDVLLRDSVRRRMVSDVPIGALLSGGIDSSLVTALMAEQAGRTINTFSIGFTDKKFDEAPNAKQVALHLGTNHTELYAEAHHALDMIVMAQAWLAANPGV
jgi:asparagine synthase (glutamine-hydrolysing)